MSRGDIAGPAPPPEYEPPGGVIPASIPPWAGLGKVPSIPRPAAPSLNRTSVPGINGIDDPTMRASVRRNWPETWTRSGPMPPRTWTGTFVTYSFLMTCTIELLGPRMSSGRTARLAILAIAVVGTPAGRARRPESSCPLLLGKTTEAAAYGVASSRSTAYDSGKGRIACTLPVTSCSSTATVIAEPTETLRRSTGRMVRRLDVSASSTMVVPFSTYWPG